jgi:hypothetical protein
MSENYKGYLIATTAWRNAGDKWKPKVTINPTGSNDDVSQYTHERQYSSEAEAETAGVQWAKQLIDSW